MNFKENYKTAVQVYELEETCRTFCCRKQKAPMKWKLGVEQRNR